MVLLPDHLHALWTLPEGDADFSLRWAVVKQSFTLGWLATDGRRAAASDSFRRGRRQGVWQRRFWEHAIRDPADFSQHLDYIHYNPVKHGLASCPHTWPYSTFRKWVERSAYAADWNCGCGKQVVRPPDFRRMDGMAME